MMERQKEVKKVKVETPFISLESDSGSHLVDVGTVIVIIVIFFLMKNWFKTT